MNKKEATAKSILIYQERINQVDAKLKDQSLSDLQRIMYESEKVIATEELAKIQTAK
ncbi:MAG: hypothetical protein KGI05_07900 [Thaumarchaeota archaeon]|nr:hypothetical protein [Nitrososphaerota archaeon]